MWYAVMMLVDMRVFFVFNMSDHVDETVDNKDNLEEKTREDTDISMYYLGLNLFK